MEDRRSGEPRRPAAATHGMPRGRSGEHPAAGARSCGGDRRDHRTRGGRGRPGRRPRCPGGDRGSRALALDRDRRPREPGAGEPVRNQGRRTPGVERLGGDADDRALVRAPAGARPRLGQAARVPRPARDQLPARRARRRVPRAAARLRRAAELSVADQGPRPGRLLHGLGRHRGDPGDLGRARPPLRRGGTSTFHAAAARSPCSATPSWTRSRLGGDLRPGRRKARRGALDRRSQPAVARPRRAGHVRRPPAGDVRGRRLADGHGQVRPAAARAVRARRRRRSAAADRRDGERGVPAAAAQRRGRAARAVARLGPRAAGNRAPGLRARRLGGARRDPGPRWPRPRLGARGPGGMRRGRRSALGPVRVHDQGLAPADRGPSGQPLRPAQRGPAHGAGGRAGRRPGRSVGPLRRRERRGPDLRGGGRTPAPRSDPADRAAAVAGRARSLALRARLHPAGARQAVRRPLPRGAGGRIPSGDREPRRRVVDQPRRLDQPGRRSGRSETGSTGSPTTPTRSCAGARRTTASTSSSGSRRSTSSACSASSGDLVAGRSAAPPGGDDLRPVPDALLRAVGVRDLRRRPVDPDRYPVGGDPRPGGWRPPVGRHPVGRHRAARLRRVGAGVRPGPRVDVPARALAAGRADGESAYFRLSTRPIDQSLAAVPAQAEARERRRHDVLGGAIGCARRLGPRGS